MNESIEIIRFEIDGKWSAAEMGISLLHMEELYNIRLMLQWIYEDWHDWEKYYFELMHFPPLRRSIKRRMLHPGLFAGFYPPIQALPIEPKDISRISKYLYPEEQLEVRKIQYGSPGFKDIAGIGEIVGHVKDFILKIIEFVVLKKRRNLENEILVQEIDRKRIENARSFVQLAKDCGYTEQELRSLMNIVDDKQSTFIHLVDAGKIKSVKILDENKEQEE